MAAELRGRRIAILAAEGVEQVELEEPRKAVQEAGAVTELLSIKSGQIQAVRQDIHPTVTFRVDRLVSEAAPEDYDALILPGGTVSQRWAPGRRDAVRSVHRSCGRRHRRRPAAGDRSRAGGV